jgi:hypothetical protein
MYLKPFMNLSSFLMNRRCTSRYAQAICINLLVALSFGCSDRRNERQPYLDDAEAFCAVHESNKWADVSPEMSIEAFNRLVMERELEAVKTQRFKDLVKQLGEVQFYRELYPTAEREIEAITGTEWDCPPYAAFTALTVQHEEAESSESSSAHPGIRIASSGDLFLGQQPLDLKSDQLKEFIANRVSDGPLVIKLDEGVGDEALDPLFQILSELEVTDVSVISD